MAYSFDINKFNIVQDEDNYYFFRALNSGDKRDRESGIVTDNEGNLVKIRTDRARYVESNEKAPNYEEQEPLSLEQIIDHIKIRHSYDTNCISLSSNANVSVIYGRKYYNDQYARIKVPKAEMGKTVVNAGQYILEEIEKRIGEAVLELESSDMVDEKKSQILTILKQLESVTDYSGIEELMQSFYKLDTSSNERYFGTKLSEVDKVPLRARFSNSSNLTEAQNLEKNKIIAKLTILTQTKAMSPILKGTYTNKKLLGTLGIAISSSELIHYGEIPKEPITEVSKEFIEIISILQQGKDKNPELAPTIDKIEQEILLLINSGYRIENRAGTYIAVNNSNNEISLGQSDVIDNNVVPNSRISISDAYDITGGKLDYEETSNMVRDLYFLGRSVKKTRAFVGFINNITGNNPEYQEVLEKIRESSFAVEPEIIDRKGTSKYRLSEGVSINIKSSEEALVRNIHSLSDEDLDRIIEANGKVNPNNILLVNLLSAGRESSLVAKDKNEYYTNAIFYLYNWEENGINFTEEQKKVFIKKLKENDVERIYEKLLDEGFEESDIASIILNLITSENSEISELLDVMNNTKEDVSQKIYQNIDELNAPLTRSRVEDYLGFYKVEGTELKLKDYQKIAVDKTNKIFENKKFASVIMPTGSGKSFVAIAELIAMQKKIDKDIENKIEELKKQPENIGLSDDEIKELALSQVNTKMLYLAPSNEILLQIKKYVVKYVRGTADSLGKTDDEIFKEVFPNLELATYQSLLEKSKDELESQKYRFIVLDELHRTGAKQWGDKLNTLLDSQDEDVRVLGITATPERDREIKNKDGQAVRRNMADEIALRLGYTKEEVEDSKHIAKRIDLIDAIRLGIVVNPKIIQCEYNLKNDKGQWENYKKKIDSMPENTPEEIAEKKAAIALYESIRTRLEKAKEIPELLRDSLIKKDGRYVLFMPVGDPSDAVENEDGSAIPKKTGKDKIRAQEAQAREWLSLIEPTVYKEVYDENGNRIEAADIYNHTTYYDKDGNIVENPVESGPEIYSMLGEYGDKKNAEQLNQFEESDSSHIKIMLVMNKLNEGVHVEGIDGIIWQRALDEDSRILLLQQLGRVIYALDEENPISDEDRPIVADLANNLIRVSIEKIINTYTERDDLNLLQDVIDWVELYGGKLPDINSSSREEYRLASTLRRIKQKYFKYIESPELLNELSEEQYTKVDKILTLAEEKLDLWEIVLPEKVENTKTKDTSNLELENLEFSLDGVAKDLVELDSILWEDNIDSIQKFIESLKKIKSLGVDVSNLSSEDTIRKLVEKSNKYSQEEINDVIKSAGLNPKENIGKKLTNIRSSYRGCGKGTKPTAEQIEEITGLGITLERSIINVQDFIEILKKIQALGVNLSDLMGGSTTIRSFVKDSKKYREEEIDQIINNIGLNPDYKIGKKLEYIRSLYRGKSKELNETQIAEITKLGIKLDKSNPIQDFIDSLRKLQELGVDISKLEVTDTIRKLVKKSKKDSEKEIDEMIRSIGLNPDKKIGSKLREIRDSYNENSVRRKPTDEQIAEMQELKIPIFGKVERDAIQEYIEKLKILRELGVNVSKLRQSDKVGSLIRKTPKYSNYSDDEIASMIDEKGLTIGDSIGSKLGDIRKAHKGKSRGRKPTEAQIEELRLLGITMSGKNISAQDIRDSSYVSSVDLCDAQETILNNLIQEKENNGKNRDGSV